MFVVFVRKAVIFIHDGTAAVMKERDALLPRVRKRRKKLSRFARDLYFLIPRAFGATTEWNPRDVGLWTFISRIRRVFSCSDAGVIYFYINTESNTKILETPVTRCRAEKLARSNHRGKWMFSSQFLIFAASKAISGQKILFAESPRGAEEAFMSAVLSVLLDGFTFEIHCVMMRMAFTFNNLCWEMWQVCWFAFLVIIIHSNIVRLKDVNKIMTFIFVSKIFILTYLAFFFVKKMEVWLSFYKSRLIRTYN